MNCVPLAGLPRTLLLLPAENLFQDERFHQVPELNGHDDERDQQQRILLEQAEVHLVASLGYVKRMCACQNYTPCVFRPSSISDVELCFPKVVIASEAK
jgi:hypothetical protein